MNRALLVALLLGPAVFAQGGDDLVQRVLDPRTRPAQRIKDLDRISRLTGGLDKLAAAGLDPALDPEVIHAVVDTLLSADQYTPYVARIVALLLTDAHREKVRERIQGLGQDPVRGAALLTECERLAREGDSLDQQRAALLALEQIPQRRALEVIIETGRANPKLEPQARRHAATWLGAPTLNEAAAVLASHPNDSFFDLARRRVKQLEADIERRSQMAKGFIGSAPLEEVLGLLGDSSPDTRRAASARVKELATKNNVKDPVKVAERVYAAVLSERDRDGDADTPTLANHVETLRTFTKKGADSPLWKAVDRKKLLADFGPLARWTGTEEEMQQLGSAAVRLLAVADEEGSALSDFAENFRNTAVRKEAIQYLGNLANVEARRPYVGLKLAGLLKRGEKDAAVRTQILLTLTQPNVPVNDDAIDAIVSFLGGAVEPPLSDGELRDSITILGRSPGQKTLDVLVDVALKHPKVSVRRLAIEAGLLERARRDQDPKKEKEILDLLRKLAVDASQPVAMRAAIIEALGAKGTRSAHGTLNAIRADKTLDKELAAAATQAKLALALRLATRSGSAASRDDLAVAALILEEESGGDADSGYKLAESIVRAGDAGKLPVGSARYQRARLYAKRADKDEAILIGYYEDAVNKARFDLVPVDLHRQLLDEYKRLLKDKTDPESLQKLIACTRELAQLAMDQKDRALAARLYLDAADCAVKLENATLLEELLNKAESTGGVAAGESAERHKKQLAVLDRLKKKTAG